MACSGVAGSFYRCEPNTACGWQNDRGAQNAKRPWGPEEDKQSDQRDQVGVRPGREFGRRGRLPEGTEGEGNEI